MDFDTQELMRNSSHVLCWAKRFKSAWERKHLYAYTKIEQEAEKRKFESVEKTTTVQHIQMLTQFCIVVVTSTAHVPPALPSKKLSKELFK